MPPIIGLRQRQELPKDFTLRTGQDYIATEKEMKQFATKSDVKVKDDMKDCKLPWTSGEELLDDLDGHPSHQTSQAPQVPQPNLIHSFAPMAAVAAVALAASLLALAARRRGGASTARGPLLQSEAVTSAAAPAV